MSPQYPAHLLRTQSLSVISLLSLLSMPAALCYLVLVRSLVCRMAICCFLLSILSSWHHIAPRSNLLTDLVMQCWYCSLLRHIGVSASSVLASRRIGPTYRSLAKCGLPPFPPRGTSSTVTSSPALLSSAIVSISWSIRLKAANFQQSESGTSDSISGSLISRSKRIRMLLGQHLTSSFILKFASTRS